ncbi:MAG: serine/threonine-protein phosphatase, partial [Bacteroidetes bacterium]
LGVFEDAHFPTGTIPLDEIERLILFTDGVLEAENSKGECFFEGRLKEIVAAGTEQSLVDLLDEILKRVLTFCESNHFDDDVCLLGIDLNLRATT